MTTLMAIGGAVDFEELTIFEEFIRRAGGAKARIVVLPQVSGLANTGKEYCQTFQGLGVKQKPISLEFRVRAEADKPRHLEALRNATGIFIAGGTQMRITTILGGTRFESALLSAYKRGVVVAGTSAGAAVMSSVMLAYGKSGGNSTRTNCSILARTRLHRQDHFRPALPPTRQTGTAGVCDLHAPGSTRRGRG